MGGFLSLATSGGKLDPKYETEGKVIGTTVGVVGGAVVGNVLSDVVVIGDPRITLYGSIIVGSMLGYVYVSNGAGLIAQATQITA